MKLWLLVNQTYEMGELDIVQRLVVRAPDYSAARGVACGEAGDEGSAVWLDESKTTCVELTGVGECEAIAVVAMGF